MVAESLAKQEEEGILCSPTSQIENVNEEEMDTSISHYKRKVTVGLSVVRESLPLVKTRLSHFEKGMLNALNDGEAFSYPLVSLSRQ